MKLTHYISTWIVLILVFPATLLAQYGPPWVKSNVGYNYILRGIDFPSNQNTIGFVAGESLTYNGDGIVLKTTDGGSTWNPVWQGTNMGIEGSCFVDLNTGFVAGWPKTASGWSGFGKTTDGGITWTSPATVPNVYYFTDVVFKDPNNGILVGATNTSPVVLVTSNGGNSWVQASGASGNFPQHACYVSGNTYFLTDNGGHIKKSVDNGLTWTTVHTIPGLYLLGIEFFDDNHGMACGDNGVLVKTTDGGATWQNQQVGTDIWHDFGWQDQDHLFCVGTPELVIESINGGSSWFNGFPQSSFNAALYDCIFTENGTGFICGSQGTLLKRQPSCTAAFTASTTNICAGEQVAFSSQSTGNVSTYDWSFPGGTPSSSNNSDPTVVYNSPGTYDVQLIVNNGFWSDTLLKSAYIHVSQALTPVITAQGNLLTSNVASGNQWYRDGNQITGANGQNYLAAQTGWYWARVTVNGCISDTSNHIYILMTGSEENTNPDFRISRESGSGHLMVEFDPGNQAEGEFQVLSIEGKLTASVHFRNMDNGSPARVDLGPLQKGFYIIKMVLGHKTIVKKIVVP